MVLVLDVFHSLESIKNWKKIILSQKFRKNIKVLMRYTNLIKTRTFFLKCKPGKFMENCQSQLMSHCLTDFFRT